MSCLSFQYLNFSIFKLSFDEFIVITQRRPRFTMPNPSTIALSSPSPLSTVMQQEVTEFIENFKFSND